ncbi:MAG TPA: mechanosensitive ion channel family protein [Gemmatimonadaceae bacterium]
MELREILATHFYGNTLLTWLIAAGVLLVTLAALLLVRRLTVISASRLAARTDARLDDLLADVVAQTHGLLLVVLAVAAASVPLTLPPAVPRYIHVAVGSAVIIQLLIWGNATIAGWVSRESKAREGALGTLMAMAFLARLVLWAIVVLLLLDNFGLNVTTLIGALGVAGIAGALAAQSVLGDLFAAISIYLDKPFEVGDFIVFGSDNGVVQNVGLRSTRLKSLEGEQLIVSNADLLKSRIRNYKRMVERRIVFQIGVVYDISRERVAAIPGIIRAVVEEQEKTRFDRSHFKGFGGSSLDFETVYYVLSPDYNIYMDIQNAINLGILKRFEENEIGFAYPTRTVIVQGAGSDAGAALAPAGDRRQ